MHAYTRRLFKLFTNWEAGVAYRVSVSKNICPLGDVRRHSGMVLGVIFSFSLSDIADQENFDVDPDHKFDLDPDPIVIYVPSLSTVLNNF